MDKKEKISLTIEKARNSSLKDSNTEKKIEKAKEENRKMFSRAEIDKARLKVSFNV